MQWITQAPPAYGVPAGPPEQPAQDRPAAVLRPGDANRADLRKAIEARLPQILQHQLGSTREVSGCLRAAVNLSCDHADAWMRRTLAQAWHQRTLTPSELQDGLHRAEAYAGTLLNEADDQRLHQLIFPEEEPTIGAHLRQTLG